MKDYSHSSEFVPPHEYALELTVRGAKLQGLLGPIFLITPLGFLAWRRRWGKPLLLAGLFCALPWMANAGTRFLIPALVFWSLAAGLALCLLPRRIAPFAACLVLGFHAVSSWPSILREWHPESVWVPSRRNPLESRVTPAARGRISEAARIVLRRGSKGRGPSGAR